MQANPSGGGASSAPPPVSGDLVLHWWPAQSKYVLRGWMFVGGGSVTPLLMVWALVAVAQIVVENLDAYPVIHPFLHGRSSQVPGTLLLTRLILPVLMALLLVTAHTDPGVLPRAIPGVSSSAAGPSSTLANEPAADAAAEPCETDQDGRNYCYTCDLRRPLGGSHCTLGERCPALCALYRSLPYARVSGKQTFVARTTTVCICDIMRSYIKSKGSADVRVLMIETLWLSNHVHIIY
jgi:hypothetical protein